MAGRKPKPFEQKVIEGNPGKRRLVDDRPPTPNLAPVMPADFTAEQAAIWTETLAAAPKGVIKAADTELLVAFVMQVDIARQAKEEWDADPQTVVMCDSGPKKNPVVTVLREAAIAIRSLGGDLGLTPISREKMHSGGAKDGKSDPWDEFGGDTAEARPQ